MKTNLLMATLLLTAASVQAAESPLGMGHDHHAGAAHAWTVQPLLKARVSGKDSNGMVVNIVPQNIVVDGIAAWSNDRKPRPTGPASESRRQTTRYASSASTTRPE